MYLQNKYTRWYNSIIQRAQARNLPSEIYTERHHILPRSLGGGDEATNLVRLTAKEHFICHLCLTKMVKGRAKSSMAYAAWQMTMINNRPRHVITASVYEMLRKNLAESYRGVPKKTKHWLGKRHTEKTRLLQSKVKSGSLNPNFGVKQHADWNRKKSLAQIGIPKPKFICNVCGQEVGGRSNLIRWHNDNCSKRKL